MKITQLLILCFCSVFLCAQDFESELSDDQILKYKDEVEFNYNLFHESIINILDEELTLEQRYISRFVLTELFSNSNSTVQDYLDSDVLKRYNISEYSYRLFDLENKLGVLDKSYKFSDSIYITSNTTSIQEKYLSLPKQEQFEKFFKVYKGDVYFVEKYVSSTSDSLFDVKAWEDLKRIKFRLIHNEFDSYELEFQHIEVLDKKRKQYKSTYDEVLASSKPWSKEVEELTLKNIVAEAKNLDYKVAFSDTSTVPIGDIVKDNTTIANSREYKLRPIKFYEYLIPGIGHAHLNATSSKKLRSTAYTGLFVGAVGTSFYFWNKGNINRLNYEGAFMADEKQLYKEKSDKYFNRAKTFGIAAGAVFVTNIIHLGILNYKRKQLLKDAGYSSFSLYLGEEMGNPAVGLSFIF